MCDTATRREKTKREKENFCGKKGKGNKNDSKRTEFGSENCVCGGSDRRIERTDGSGADDVRSAAPQHHRSRCRICPSGSPEEKVGASCLQH